MNSYLFFDKGAKSILFQPGVFFVCIKVLFWQRITKLVPFERLQGVTSFYPCVQASSIQVSSVKQLTFVLQLAALDPRPNTNPYYMKPLN